MGFEQWLESCSAYTTVRREVLRAAHRRIVARGLARGDSRIQAFLKFEKLTSEGDPRVIQPTTDEYLVSLGPMIKPIDKILGAKRYEFTKGLSYEQLGARFAEHVKLYRDPVTISIDFSRFDAHVSADLLAVEHYVYCLVAPNTELAAMLAWQVNVRGKTRSGFEYQRSGGRCSGHPNTSCGNAILNLLMHRVVLHFLQVRASVFVNGDDALIILERAEAAKWHPELYQPFGMKVEGTTTELAWAEYCSGRFMPYRDTFLFVRDLPKALFKLPWALKRLTPTQARARRHDVLHAELSQQPCVPVYTAFCRYHHDLLPCTEPDRRILSWHMQEFDLSLQEARDIEPRSRLWFADVYGVSPAEQIAAEHNILSSGWDNVLTRLAMVGFQPLDDAREAHDSIFHHWNLTYVPAIDQECVHPPGEGCAVSAVGCCRDSSLGPCWDYAARPHLPTPQLRRPLGRVFKGRHVATEEEATSPPGFRVRAKEKLPFRTAAWEFYCEESHAERKHKKLGRSA